MNNVKNWISLRMIISMAVFLCVMLFVGGLMRIKLNSMLQQNVEQQVAGRASVMAKKLENELNSELSCLTGLATEFEQDNEAYKKVLPLYESQNGQKGNTYGLLALDGTALYGEKYTGADFLGIIDSFRGNAGVSYSDNYGLLFTVPVFNNGNVKYVLYELYDKSSILNSFEVDCYDGLGYAVVSDLDGNIVIGSSNVEYSTDIFWDEKSFGAIEEELNDLLNISVSACVNTKVAGQRVYYFKTDIKWSGMKLVGVVANNIAAPGLTNITVLVIWVFGLLLLIFMFGGFYVFLSERKVQESEELREAKLAAENANQAKSDFLANMSHEIRTPMNVINGMADFIVRDSKDEEAKQNAMQIRNASTSLLAIINDILDFSKIEAGKLEIIDADYDLASLIRDIETMVDVRLQDKEVSMVLDIDENIPKHLYGDEVRIKQILINILNNAVKFTNAGTITLKMSSEKIDDDSVRIFMSVKDTGIGIKEQDLDKLFSSFSQVDTKRNRAMEGTGLGLAISKKLTKLMNGDISVQSTYGEGSTFSWSIINKVTDWEKIGDIRKGNQTKVVDTFTQSFEAPLAHILIVDDNQMNLKVAEGILKPYQMMITTALSGKDAISQVQKEKFDLIFMDHMMPGMDGVEALQHIRELENGKDVTVIALTANAISGVREKYLELGFADFLAKPIDRQKMDELLCKFVMDEKKCDVGKENIAKENLAMENIVMENLSNENVSIENISQINLETGLEYCMNDMEFYMEMVKEYLAGDKREELNTYKEQEDWANYQIAVHALKSTSLTIGAVDLSEHAKELEFACKESAFNVVMEKHDFLMQEYKELLDLLKKL